MAELDGVLACTRGILVRADDLVVVESSWAAILQDCDHILGQCCYRVGGRVSGGEMSRVVVWPEELIRRNQSDLCAFRDLSQLSSVSVLISHV